MRNDAHAAARGAALLLIIAAAGAAAQATDQQRCDSIVAASRVDTVSRGLFLAVQTADGSAPGYEQLREIVVSVGAAFTPPKPFRLTVFSGPARARALRVVGGDSTTSLRAPTVTGVYQVITSAAGIDSIRVARAALMPGFDSAAIAAIRTAAISNPAFAPTAGTDMMVLNIGWSTDSIAGARRLVSATFPRMPVVDAVPLDGNPPPQYPDSAKGGSLGGGEVVLRFVVGRDGLPEFDTMQLVRTTDLVFVRAALITLSKHRFRPATIRGCAVAQEIDYAMNFSPPAGHSPSAR